MKVELDKRDIINLLKGTSPSYAVEDIIPRDLGHMVHGIGEYWEWNFIPENIHYTEEELYNYYLIIKNHG